VADAPTVSLAGDSSGYENTPIQLQQIAAELADQDGSESLTLTIEDLPVGAVLSDGDHTFTATAVTRADISD